MTEDEFVHSQCGAPACADRQESLARGGDALLACVPHGGAADDGKVLLTGLDPSMLIGFMVRD
jgi:hypothetical protein